MLWKTRHLALQVGYDIETDYRFVAVLAIGARQPTPEAPRRYRLILKMGLDLPRITWRNETWAVNEPGYIRGMPVARRGIRSSTWTGRSQQVWDFRWPHIFAWSYRG